MNLHPRIASILPAVLLAGAASLALPATATARPHTKRQLPVEVSFQTSARTGRVVATLDVHALKALPASTVRFVVPSGVAVVAGQTELALGSLRQGERRRFQLTLDVPAKGTFQLGAGLDLRLAAHVKYHEGRTLELGEVARPRTQSKIVALPAGGGARVGKAQRLPRDR